MIKKVILRDFPAADIIPYERNCQKHDRNVQDIANSLRDFGYLKISILIDEANILIAGHGSTMIAAHKHGRASCLVELDERFCDVIVARYLRFTGQKMVVKNGEKITW